MLNISHAIATHDKIMIVTIEYEKRSIAIALLLSLFFISSSFRLRVVASLLCRRRVVVVVSHARNQHVTKRVTINIVVVVVVERRRCHIVDDEIVVDVVDQRVNRFDFVVVEKIVVRVHFVFISFARRRVVYCMYCKRRDKRA